MSAEPSLFLFLLQCQPSLLAQPLYPPPYPFTSNSLLNGAVGYASLNTVSTISENDILFPKETEDSESSVASLSRA